MGRAEVAAIAQQWQRQIDESLEGGEPLWLELGVSNRLLDHVQALTALHLLANQRADVTTPGLFVGGDGAVWLTACMNPAVTTSVTATPGMTLLYGGADRVTYMASLATLPGPAAHLRQRLLTGLPTGLHSWLWPSSQPGAPAPWSALPFRLTALPPSMHTNDAGADGDLRLSWLVLVVVIGLVLAALFI